LYLKKETLTKLITRIIIKTITLYRSERVSKMRARKRSPSHPGRIIRMDYLEPLKLTISEMADILGVSRKTASKIVNGHGSVTPNMALRLSKAFDTTPELWLNLQVNHDLWRAMRDSREWMDVHTVPRLADTLR